MLRRYATCWVGARVGDRMLTFLEVAYIVDAPCWVGAGVGDRMVEVP